MDLPLAGTVIAPVTEKNDKKLNAIHFGQDYAHVDDLNQTWHMSSIGYERYTPLGAVILTVNRAYRFKSYGTQYELDAYPHILPNGYAYLSYAKSSTSYFPKNYYAFEPFFSLPHAMEFSIGGRVLQFSQNTVDLYTGSIAKYWGNYWFSLRPYFSNAGSHSLFLTARRYYATADSYVGLTVGGGTGPSTYNSGEDPSSDKSASIRLNGETPVAPNLSLSWLVSYSYDHFANNKVRHETDGDVGLTWQF
jgi:YaiO family outer membrane protein